MRRPRVMVVDDDPRVRDALHRALVLKGFEVALAAGGDEALSLLVAGSPDVVVLDGLMPDVDGLEVCRRLREAGDRTPVLMLTARDAVADRVAGLEAGADDYLVKPFALEELIARLRALLRRSGAEGERRTLRFGDLALDQESMTVTVGVAPLTLTRTEYLLMELLLTNPRRVLTHEVIYERVWGYDMSLATNSLAVYVSTLRRKVEEAGSPRVIHTVRGVGYVLRDP